MAVKNPIFKILRCPDCGKQNRHTEPLTTIPPCPRCGGSPTYSAWYIKVIVDGKPHIQEIGRQKSHAESALKKAEAEIFYDTYQINQESPLLSTAITTLYDARWKKKKDGSGTQRRAELLMEIIGDIPISSIGKKHMQQLAKVLAERGTGDTTANKYRSVLRSLLRYHDLSYRFIEFDPETEGRICVISDAEEKQIINLFSTVDSTKHRREFYVEMPDLCACLVDTGMRPTELLKLPPNDINFDTNMLTIWINKADKPRSIHMTKRARRILKKRVKKENGKLFDIDIFQADKAWEWMRKELKREHEEDFVLYALRHTSVTRQLIAGADVVRVKEWHGHKSLKTTMRYTHLAPHDLKSSLLLLEKRKPSTNRQQTL